MRKVVLMGDRFRGIICVYEFDMLDIYFVMFIVLVLIDLCGNIIGIVFWFVKWCSVEGNIVIFLGEGIFVCCSGGGYGFVEEGYEI